MKYLKYLGIALIFSLTIAFGFSQTSQIILESTNPNISESLLTEAAEIIENRLQAVKVEVISSTIIGGTGKIQIEYLGEISDKWRENLLTRQGQLRFRETLDRTLFIKTISEEDPIFELLGLQVLNREIKDEENAVLATLKVELIEDLSVHVHRLHEEGKLPSMDVAWDLLVADQEDLSIYLLKAEAQTEAFMAGMLLDRSHLNVNQDQVAIMLEFNKVGAEKWANMTKKNIDKMLAITLDDQVLMAPRVRVEISGGKCQITGDFDEDEGRYLLAMISSGELPAKFEISN